MFVSALRVSTENQPSIRFNHEALVEVKCRCPRSRFGSASQVRLPSPTRTSVGLSPAPHPWFIVAHKSTVPLRM